MSSKYLKFALAATLIPSGILFGFQSATAEDTQPVVRGDETCFPIQDASKRLKADSLEPDRRDTVDSFLEAHFADVENRSLPMKLYLKDSETRAEFIVSESGEVEDFHNKVFGASSDAKICGLTREDGKIGIAMSPSVRFKNRSGTHTLAEILDGKRDGKKHHKKNLGGAMALFVPKMTHVAVRYDDPKATPNVSAITNGESVHVELEPYSEMLVIDVEALRYIDAESINIGGGPYKLFPVPSVKKMKSLGIN